MAQSHPLDLLSIVLGTAAAGSACSSSSGKTADDGASSSASSSGSGSSSGSSGSGGSSDSSSSSGSGSGTASSSGSGGDDGGSGDATAREGGGGDAGEGGAPVASTGCGKAPTLKNDGYNMITSGGMSRQYTLRWPTSYKDGQPYRLILGFHGARGKGSDLAPGFFGIYDLSNESTIFLAPDAIGGIWSAAQDTTLVDDILTQVEADLCIDTTRVELEGFSQGAAMTWTLACARPDVFRVAVVHSGGGLPLPTTCKPIPFFSSLGHDGSGQGMSSDFFAMTDGCTVAPLPTAPTGGHQCTDYQGCSPGFPVRWCAYDGGHTPSPTDNGMSMSWMPQEVWTFIKQF